MKIALGCVHYRLPKTNYEHFKKHLLNLAQKSDWLFTGFYRIIFFQVYDSDINTWKWNEICVIFYNFHDIQNLVYFGFWKKKTTHTQTLELKEAMSD